MIGKAIAGEAKATFFYISASSLTSKWVCELYSIVVFIVSCVTSCIGPFLKDVWTPDHGPVMLMPLWNTATKCWHEVLNIETQKTSQIQLIYIMLSK